MAPKPQEVEEIKVVDKIEALGGLEDHPLDDKFMQYLHRITMIMKKDFENANYIRSGRYYLLEKSLLTATGRKCSLLVSLQTIANFYPCGATFQACYYEVPMLSLRSPSINDLSSLKIKYWDNSCLYMKEGLTVGVKIPTEIVVEWLTSPSEAEKTTIEKTMSTEEINNWSAITVPNPDHYPNRELFVEGHLDSYRIKDDIVTVMRQATDKLTES